MAKLPEARAYSTIGFDADYNSEYVVVGGQTNETMPLLN